MARVIGRRSRTSVVGVARRKTQWVASVDVTAVTNIAANTILLDSVSNAAVLSLRPFTVVRVRGTLWVQSDSEAADRTPFGAVGFAVVSDNAASIGVTAVPHPIADEDSSLWFVYQYFLASRTFVSAAGIQGTEDWGRYDFDSKAMRKVEVGSTIATVIQNRAAVGGVNYIWKYRYLVKLH